MEKIKTIVDREPVSSGHIKSKQNFGHVLSEVKNLKAPIWKTAWFYGPVGLAVIAVVVSVVNIDPTSELANEANTLSQEDLVVEMSQAEPTLAMNVATTHVAETSEIPEPTSNSEVPVSAQPEDLPTTQTSVEPTVAPVVNNDPLVKRVVVDNKKINMLPHIENHFTGEIPFAILSNENGIQCNDDVKVVAFEIHYNTQHGTETASVVGNKIPQEVLDNIKRYNIGYMVFITDIKGLTGEGKVMSLTSMNFIATN